jgi:hypothetical protein
MTALASPAETASISWRKVLDYALRSALPIVGIAPSHNVVHAAERLLQPLAVPNIAQKEPQAIEAALGKLLLHLVLLQLVAAVNDQPPG